MAHNPPGPRAGRPRRSRAWLPRRPAAAACAAILLASACATVPDSGPVQRGQVTGGQPQNFLQLIPVSPKPGWSPEQIVSGFLTASASFASNHAVARQYLTPAAAKLWHPGWAVTVVGSALGLGQLAMQAYRQVGQVVYEVHVQPTGQKLAFLTDNGQYAHVKDVLTDKAITFNVNETSQGYRISNPPNYLMLTAPDFQRVYQPRNLYFLADVGEALVPYPVFVPLQATSVSLATTLVKALLQDPQGWLEGAARTAIPPGSWQIRPVTVSSNSATVDLGGAAATAGKTAWQEMADQLVWTLAGPSGGLPAIQSVQLEIDGHRRASANWSVSRSQQPGPGQHTVPETRADVTAYSIGHDGAVQALAGGDSVSGRVGGQAGDGQEPLTKVAVSPDGRYVAGLTRSGHVYFGAIGRGARLRLWREGGGFTSVSWDNHDDLWVAGPGAIWLQSPQGGLPFPVSPPDGYQVRTFLVAPDAVRAAMIVVPSGGGPAQVRLAAITRPPSGSPVLGPTVTIGSTVANPTDLTWYDADNLLVLSWSQSAAQLQEVPVNGGTAININTYPGTISISAAGPANPLLAGLAGGRLAWSANVNGNWIPAKGIIGLDPTYPG